MHALVSVDGFIADGKDDVGPLFDWYFNGDIALQDGEQHLADNPFRLSEASYDYTRPMWDSIRASIMGRHLPRFRRSSTPSR
jgi:hypothetical protein